MEEYILEALEPLTFSKVRRPDSSALTEEEFVAVCSAIYHCNWVGRGSCAAGSLLTVERDGTGLAISERHHPIPEVHGSQAGVYLAKGPMSMTFAGRCGLCD